MQSVVIVNKVEIHVCKFVSTFVAMVMGATSRDFRGSNLVLGTGHC